MGIGLSSSDYASQIQSDLIVINKLSADTQVKQQQYYVLQPISIPCGRKDPDFRTQSNSTFQSRQDSFKQSNSRLQNVLLGLSSGNISSNSMNRKEDDDSFRLEIQDTKESGRDVNINRLILSIRESVGRASLHSIKGEMKDADLHE